MLGKKRSASVFTPAAPASPVPNLEEKHTEKAVETIAAPAALTAIPSEEAPPAEGKPVLTGRVHSLFFTPEDDSREFPDVCREVQGYPPYTEQQATELLDGLRALAPYVVVDCGSYIANDILSAVALMESDSVLRLANCDLKSVSYFSSQLPLLKDTRWDADKQYKVASNVKPQQAAEHIGKVLGSVAFKLPYSQELEEQYLAGTLLSDLTMKDSRPYRKELDRILKEVFGC